MKCIIKKINQIDNSVQCNTENICSQFYDIKFDIPYNHKNIKFDIPFLETPVIIVQSGIVPTNITNITKHGFDASFSSLPNNLGSGKFHSTVCFNGGLAATYVNRGNLFFIQSANGVIWTEPVKLLRDNRLLIEGTTDLIYENNTFAIVIAGYNNNGNYNAYFMKWKPTNRSSIIPMMLNQKDQVKEDNQISLAYCNGKYGLIYINTEDELRFRQSENGIEWSHPDILSESALFSSKITCCEDNFAVAFSFKDSGSRLQFKTLNEEKWGQNKQIGDDMNVRDIQFTCCDNIFVIIYNNNEKIRRAKSTNGEKWTISTIIKTKTAYSPLSNIIYCCDQLFFVINLEDILTIVFSDDKGERWRFQPLDTIRGTELRIIGCDNFINISAGWSGGIIKQIQIPHNISWMACV